MVRDCLGNTLSEGQIVQLIIREAPGTPGVRVIGKITRISEGSILDPKNQQAKPGIVTLVAEFTAPFHPQIGIVGDITSVLTPGPTTTEEILSSSEKKGPTIIPMGNKKPDA